MEIVSVYQRRMEICILIPMLVFLSLFTKNAAISNYESDRIIAVINIDNNYFSYAYYVKEKGHHINQDTCEISKHTLWHVSEQIPATIVLDSSKNVLAIGVEAEGGLELEDHRKYFFFRKFNTEMQMMKNLSRDSNISDIFGHQLKALKVLSLYFVSLKNMLFSDIVKKIGNNFNNYKMEWTLTVPASWSKAVIGISKEALQLTDEKHGLHSITLAFEEEVDVIFTKECTKFSDTQDLTHKYEAGKTYAILNIGENEADFTVLEVTENQTLKQVLSSNAREWVWENIYEECLKPIKQIVGPTVIGRYTYDFIDIEYELSEKMRNLEICQNVAVEIPIKVIEEAEFALDKNMQTIINNNYTDLFEFHRPNKLIFKSFFIQKIFCRINETLNSMIDTVTSRFRPTPNREIYIMLLGEISDFKIVRKIVEQKFPLHKIIDTDRNVAMSISLGAVLFHLNQSLVTSRVSKVTIGYEPLKPCVQGDHNQIFILNYPYCHGVFKTIVRKGEELDINTAKNTKTMYLESGNPLVLYQCSDVDVHYVADETCSYLGKLILPIHEIIHYYEFVVDISIIFGNPELTAEIEDDLTGQHIPVTFDPL